jgi:hypothetical protein
MGFGETFVAITGCIFVFGIPLSIIWTHHRRKMMELQLRLKGEGDVSVRGELSALREEVRALRDTSMQYDLSFDTALQKMEQRMIALERKSNQQEIPAAKEIHLGL